MATFLYTRHSPKNRAYPEQLNTLKAYAPEAVHLEDKVRGCTPPAERQAFQQLLNTVQTGDTVVLWWLTAFGRDFSQALSTIQTLLNKAIYTVDPTFIMLTETFYRLNIIFHCQFQDK